MRKMGLQLVRRASHNTKYATGKMFVASTHSGFCSYLFLLRCRSYRSICLIGRAMPVRGVRLLLTAHKSVAALRFVRLFVHLNIGVA